MHPRLFFQERRAGHRANNNGVTAAYCSAVVYSCWAYTYTALPTCYHVAGRHATMFPVFGILSV